MATTTLVVGGVQARCCVDTGAGKNYISRHLVTQVLKNGIDLVKMRAVERLVVKVADETTVNCSSAVKIPVMIGNKKVMIEFMILEALLFDCILGYSFCKENQAVIDVSERNVRFDFSGNKTMRMSSDVEIPAFSEMCVTISGCMQHENLFIVQQDPQLWEELGITVARGLLSSNGLNECLASEQKHSIMLANLTSQSVTIPKGRSVCQLTRISEEDFDVVAVTELTQHEPDCTTSSTAGLMKTKESALEQLKQIQPALDINFESFNDNECVKIVELIDKHGQVFSTGNVSPGGAKGVEHRINTGSHPPCNCPPRRVSPKERDMIDKLTQEMLDAGVCSSSNSPWASPVVLVPKKDGAIRFCVDYRKLNTITVRDVYPLPRIDDCLAALGWNKFFSTLDLVSGYWQINMSDEDKEKTAFITPSGLFEFNVLPFGLTNAPATFQRFIDVALAGLKWQCLLVYLDDICVYSSTFEDHLAALERVFARLEKFNLRLKPSKCHLFQRQFLYLGHIVNGDGVQTDPKKIDGLKKMRQPTNVSELRSFIGLCNYYRNFIDKFAIVCGPLYDLLKTTNNFVWTEVHQNTFNRLKQALIESPMLHFPDYKLPFVVQTDASDSGLGAVLSQVVREQERVIQYSSRTLQPAEKNWTVREKEALAIIFACETFKPYVYLTRFVIESDHHSLKWLMTAQSPARLVRWALRLAEFDFEIRYRKGKENANADALSRLPVIGAITDSDADESVMCLEDIQELTSMVADGDSPYVLDLLLTLVDRRLKQISSDRMLEAQRNDPSLHSVIQECEANNGMSKNRSFEIVDGLLYLAKQDGKKLLVIPWNLIEDVLYLYHNEAMSVHLSRDRLYQLLRNRFYWYGMFADVSRWVNGCIKCSQVKPTTPLNHGLLQPIMSKQPFDILGVDILGPITTSSEGYSYILVCVDLYTSWVEAGPLKTITAAEVCQMFFNLVISRHGCPNSVITDQGKQFVSKMWHQLFTSLGIAQRMASAYHHETNGKVERFNKFIENGLALLVKKDQTDWCKLLDNCLLVYRMSLNRILDETPFFLIYGRDAVMPQDLLISSTLRNQRTVGSLDQAEFKANLLKTLRKAYEKLDKHKSEGTRKMKEYYDITQKDVNFIVGDQVMLYVPAPTPDLSRKLVGYWQGPHKVVAKLDAVTYRLLIQNNHKLDYKPAHVRRLRRYEPWTLTSRPSIPNRLIDL